MTFQNKSTAAELTGIASSCAIAHKEGSVPRCVYVCALWRRPRLPSHRRPQGTHHHQRHPYHFSARRYSSHTFPFAGHAGASRRRLHRVQLAQLSHPRTLRKAVECMGAFEMNFLPCIHLVIDLEFHRNSVVFVSTPDFRSCLCIGFY